MSDLASWQVHRFVSFDTTPIQYYVLVPESPKAILLLVHGMGEHARRYLPLARHLLQSSVATYALDLRGFGSSGGGRGCVSSIQDYLQDIQALLSIIRQNHSHLPIFILGHSMGGLLASMFVSSRPQTHFFSGIILVSPLFGVRISVPWIKRVMGSILSVIGPNMTFHSKISPGTLTHDQNVIKDYELDSLIHFRVSARLYMELTKSCRQFELISSKVRIPVLLFQAENDQIVDTGKSESFFQLLNVLDKERIFVRGSYHEILNDSSRLQANEAISNWITNRL